MFSVTISGEEYNELKKYCYYKLCIDYKRILLNINKYNSTEALAFVMANSEFCIKHMNKFVDDIACYSALYIACFNNAFDVVKFLIDNGADVTKSSSHGYTPICITSFRGHTAVVELLIRNGADINQANNNGITPLKIASHCCHTAIVELLIKSGAHTVINGESQIVGENALMYQKYADDYINSKSKNVNSSIVSSNRIFVNGTVCDINDDTIKELINEHRVV